MIELKLTVEEINLVLVALAEMPYKVSAPLIDKIKSEGERQYNEQQSKAD